MGKGFDTFMANPYWRRIYAEAPSERLKEYYRLRYEISPFVMGEDYRDEAAVQRLRELRLTKSDIEYIRQFAGSSMAKQYYETFIQRLTGEREGRSFPAAAFQAEIWNPWYEESQNPQYNDAPVEPGSLARGRDRRNKTPAAGMRRSKEADGRMLGKRDRRGVLCSVRINGDDRSQREAQSDRETKDDQIDYEL